MKTNIMLGVLASLVILLPVAVAQENIEIFPDVETIIVGVDPNAISPPVNVTYTGWNTSGSTTYLINVTNDSSGVVVCSESGTITSDPQIVTLPGCILPVSSINVNHTINASAECPLGGCTSATESKEMIVWTTLNPIPELSTVVLMSGGLIGLLGLVHLRRRDLK